MRKILRLKEMLGYLSMSRGTYYNLRAAGVAPRHFYVGRNLYFDEVDVEAWVKAQKWTSDNRGDSVSHPELTGYRSRNIA